MGRSLIDDINKYTNSSSLLVHTRKKGLIRMFCPFKVEVIKPVGELLPGDILEVLKVKVSSSFELVYVVRDKSYFYYYFRILH